MPLTTERVRRLEYAIRDITAYAERLRKQGKEIIYLNIGDPVKYGFDTPEHIKQALIEAVEGGDNLYSASEGLPELKDAVCEKERTVNHVKISPENVIITSGVSEAIMMVMSAIVDKNSEVLLPGPTYPPYISYTKFFDGKPVEYRTIEENRWQPDVEDIKSKITNATRCIVIVNPNNPCGALYDEKILRDIINIAGEHELLIISDEIYDRFVYEKSFVSTSAIAKDVPVIGLNGFSKTYSMTGWRLGYIYFYDPEGRLDGLKESVVKLSRIRLCVNTPAQKAAVMALKGPQNHIVKNIEKLKQRRDFAWRRLNEIRNISCVKPDGAFYLFPHIERASRWRNDKEFVLDVLKETGVLFVHGSGFSAIHGADHFRAVFLPPIEILNEAFDRLDRFMSKHSSE